MVGKIINTISTKLIAAIINLVIVIMISQVLGPEGKGLQGILIASIAYILIFSNLIGGAAIVYLTPRYDKNLIIIPSYFWSLIIGLISYLILSEINLIHKEFVFAICLLSVINAMTGINSNILVGNKQIRKSNLVQLIQPISILIVLLIQFFIYNTKSIEAYITALYISFSIGLLYSMILTFKGFSKHNNYSLSKYLEVTKQLIRYGLLNQLAHLFQWCSFRMSYYWLNAVYTESEVGIYSNGVIIIESIWLLSKSISLVQYAEISNMNNPKAAQELSLGFTKICLILSLFLILSLILLPSSFYTFILGSGFENVKPVIVYLSPGILILNISIILGHYFSGVGKYHINTMASFIGLIAAILSFYFLIPAYSFLGAAIGSSISYIITSALVLLSFIKESEFTIKQYFFNKNDYRQFKHLIRRK